ncbi:MAG: hypothetical protein KDN05_03650 [Verrucomicrobiae bacterium]|nr:hypothetical protein [Verrucomicrobiae bacterium]
MTDSTVISSVDRLLSRLCFWLLLALPILMVYGHLRAIGVVWNHATGQTFSPLANHISDYAYRCPAWWAVVACIHAFSLFFAWLSWRAAGKRRSIVSWAVVASAAITMFQLHQVAVNPVRSPELTIRHLQEELNKGPVDKAKEQIWRIALKATGHEIPPGVPVRTYVANYERDRLHVAGIRPASYLLIVAFVGSYSLWKPQGGEIKKWRIRHALVVAVILVALGFSVWVPAWPGLSQRIMYLGVYVWFWVLLGAMRRESALMVREA